MWFNSTEVLNMAKEKFQTVETKKNERIFHYEILGIILFVLTIFTIAKLGVGIF